jgi:putative phosphoribosyl transferase
MQAMHVSRAEFEHTIATQLMELHRRELAYRRLLGALRVRGKTVILVDDGIATGSTLRGFATSQL